MTAHISIRIECDGCRAYIGTGQATLKAALDYAAEQGRWSRWTKPDGSKVDLCFRCLSVMRNVQNGGSECITDE